jgi:hypothetical protein
MNSKILVEDHNLSLKFRNQSAKDFDGCGFPCTIGSDIPDDLPGAYFQVDAIKNLARTVVFFKMADGHYFAAHPVSFICKLQI